MPYGLLSKDYGRSIETDTYDNMALTRTRSTYHAGYVSMTLPACIRIGTFTA